MREQWKSVEGFEGLYEVSDMGRVRSLDRYIATERGKRFVRGRVLSPGKQTSGYLFVQLCKDGDHKTVRVHRLVAIAFVSNPGELEEVNHKNGTKTDNRVENLEWVSRHENMVHRHRVLGQVNPRRKLSREQVLAIRKSSDSQRELADHFGVTQMTISKIKRNKCYREVI